MTEQSSTSPAVVTATDKTSEVVTKQFTIPLTMRAVQGKDYGPIDEMLTVADNVRVPQLSDLPINQRKYHILIKTITVALAPGDVRVLSGLTKSVQGPASFPYIPGGDCVGIVVDIPNDIAYTKTKNPDTIKNLQIGDIIGVGFIDGKPSGALGEYTLVHIKNIDKVPNTVPPVEAVALVSSSPAIPISTNYIQPGDRILIFGVCGGIGSHICQLARTVLNASYIVGMTSHTLSDDSIVKQCCDELYNYNTTDIFTNETFINNKFDVIFDFAGFVYQRIEQIAYVENKPLIIKTANDNGRFVTTVLLSGPIMEVKSILYAMITFIPPLLWKYISSRSIYQSYVPSYNFADGLPFNGTTIIKAFQLRSSKTIPPTPETTPTVIDAKEEQAISETKTKTKINTTQFLLQGVVDPSGPFPMTTDGIRSAFKLQESRHAYGKVVISIQ